MTPAENAARYLVELANNEAEPDPLTPMRLHKLLYYAQGWTLATRGRPLFAGRLEAFVHGPVVRELFARLPSGPALLTPELVPGDSAQLTDEERALLACIWERYRQYSASALRQMTHQEPPWINARARAGVKDGEPCSEELSEAEMAAFFQSRLTSEVSLALARTPLFPAIDSSSWQRSHADMLAGRSRSLKEARHALRR